MHPMHPLWLRACKTRVIIYARLLRTVALHASRATKHCTTHGFVIEQYSNKCETNLLIFYAVDVIARFQQATAIV